MVLGEVGTAPGVHDVEPRGQETRCKKGRALCQDQRKLVSDVPAAPLSPGIKQGGGHAHRGPLPCVLRWHRLGRFSICGGCRAGRSPGPCTPGMAPIGFLQDCGDVPCPPPPAPTKCWPQISCHPRAGRSGLPFSLFLRIGNKRIGKILLWKNICSMSFGV